jgi:hypothetical protein
MNRVDGKIALVTGGAGIVRRKSVEPGKLAS